MENNKLRIGIIGCGIGAEHAHVFHELSEQFSLTAVCDIDRSRAEEVAGHNQVKYVCSNLDDLLHMDEIDVVDLCTPSYLHYQQTLQVLAAGKHVILEKPAAGSLEQIDGLIMAEVQSGKRVMPIFQRRFGRGVQKLKWLRDHRICGPAILTTVETAWRRHPEYYSGWHGKWNTELGGALVTLAIHAHDVLTYILGPASKVSAHTATLVNPIETEDTATAALLMADGSLCTLAVTTGSAQPLTRHRFCFRNLVAESNHEPYTNSDDPWQFTGDSEIIDVQIHELLRQYVPGPEGMLGQFHAYGLAMQSNTPLPVTLQDARISLELITAIYHAAETGHLVELPIRADHPKYKDWKPHSAENERIHVE